MTMCTESSDSSTRTPSIRFLVGSAWLLEAGRSAESHELHATRARRVSSAVSPVRLITMTSSFALARTPPT